MMLGIFKLVTLLCLQCAASEPRLLYDRRTNATIDHTWLEVGFVFLDDTNWLTIDTKNDEFGNDVVAFISLPDIGGSLYNESIPLVPKLKNLPQKNADNTWSFTAKLVQAKGSRCSTEWYTPVPIEPVQVSWLAVEKCLFEMSIYDTVEHDNFINYQSLLVDTSNVTRNNSGTDLSDGSTDGNGNFNRIWYPSGCDGNDEIPCTLSNFAGRSSSAYPNYASIQQLQTSVNDIPGDDPADVGVDFFLSVRTKIINSRHIQFVLNPHSSFYPDLFEIHIPEVVGYFLFPTPLSMMCLENMVFETHVYKTVTSVAIDVPFDFHYDYPPGLFGMLGTTISIVDSTTLRTFGRTNSSAAFITQEDQCTDEQSIHITEEWAFTFVVGEMSSSVSQVKCHVKFNSAIEPPTGSPSSVPSSIPISTPSYVPTPIPSTAPSSLPSVSPTTTPSSRPAAVPTSDPSQLPTVIPSALPSVLPTFHPTSLPSSLPISSPTMTPSALPTAFPSSKPTSAPSEIPTTLPTASPSVSPTSHICKENEGYLRIEFEEHSKALAFQTFECGLVNATGAPHGQVDLQSDGNLIKYNINVMGLGSNAESIGLFHNETSLEPTFFEFNGITTSGSWSSVFIASDSGIASLFAGQAYIKVGTKGFPGGEVHGYCVKSRD